MTTGFSKTLLNREVLALSCGAMIGWSWVLLTGEWLARAGTLGTVIAFVIGSGIVLLISLTYAELAAAMPLTGGEHHYTKRALGYTASFVASWAVVVAYVTVCVFESAALPTALEYLFPDLAVGLLWQVAGSPVYLSMVLIGALATALMTFINYLGIRFAAFVQTLITVLFIAVGILFFFGVSLSPSLEPAVPQWTNGLTGILSVLVMVPALMVGFDVIPQSAEEINLPPNRIGRLLVLSVGLAGAWYIAISLAVGSALTIDGLDASTMPTADAMAAVWGSSLMGQVMLLAGIGGILTSWNAFIIGGQSHPVCALRIGNDPQCFFSFASQVPNTLCECAHNWWLEFNVAIIWAGGAGLVGGCRQLCHCRGLSVGGDVLFATSTSRTGHAEALSGALRWLGGLACADLNVWIVATVFAR